MKIKPEIVFLLIFILTIFGVTLNIVRNKNVNKNNGSYVNEISQQLDEMLVHYDADRLLLYYFNEYDPNKIGFIKHKKISCKCESTKGGIEPLCFMHQNIPTLLMTSNFKQFDTSDTLIVRDINKCKNPSVKYMMNILNCKSLYSILIKDERNVAIGLLTMQFISKSKSVKNLRQFRVTSKGIKYLLLKDR